MSGKAMGQSVSLNLVSTTTPNFNNTHTHREKGIFLLFKEDVFSVIPSFKTLFSTDIVTRSCEEKYQEKEGVPCYWTVLDEYNTFICQCYDDQCNLANL